MPATLEVSATGYLTFAAVKFAGYSLFGLVLSRGYSVKRSVWAVGGARTLLGMAVGSAYFGLWYAFSKMDIGRAPYVIGLVPIRCAEWWLLLWWFYDRALAKPRLGWNMVLLGTIWSYICDLPAILGYLLTGGLSVC